MAGKSKLLAVSIAVDSDPWFVQRINTACTISGVHSTRALLIETAMKVVDEITLDSDNVADTSAVTDEQIIEAVIEYGEAELQAELDQTAIDTANKAIQKVEALTASLSTVSDKVSYVEQGLLQLTPEILQEPGVTPVNPDLELEPIIDDGLSKV